MPSGGKRQGAGRKFGSLNKRHQVTVKDIGHDGYLPIEYMLALMRDERTEATRRDAMAIQAAPYRACSIECGWHHADQWQRRQWWRRC